MRIRELDDATVRRIAAGEVVERPASVVKELVENSLDADASRIDVAVERGGKERIRVADDGVGMTREEVRAAVREHTTSKIRDADDLDSVATLGFRGEALHAIGGVSTTTITTRPRDGDRATELRVEEGEVVSVEPAGRPEGTTVEVTDLFAGTPAREKFLKADATEFDHVNRIVSRYALANPDVAVSLIHDGREVFATTGQGDLEAAILSVYGREVAESMIGVDADGEPPVESVSGYVSHPETTRSTREYLSTFVNGRYVPARTLRTAVLDAYDKQLASDRYPFAVLFVDVAPDAVDANVHPRKLEVRFDDEAAVRERVRSAVEAALVDHGLVRTSAPRGRSAPEEADVSPDAGSTDGTDASAEATGSDSPATDSAGPTRDDPGSGDPPAPSPTRWRGGSETPGDAPDPEAPAPSDADGSTSGSGNRFRSGGTQSTLDSGTTAEREGFDRLPSMRVLGQLDDTYVVAEADGGLVLIDQHAADERVNYERLRARAADDPGVQALADPVDVELTAREAELLSAHQDALEAIGFRAERTGDRTVAVRAVPAAFGSTVPPDSIRDVLGELLRERETTSVDERVDALLADLACYPSITGNASLREGSIRELLEALDDCEDPFSCPHGRPVVIEVSADEIAERFERDYPGHSGRRIE